MVFRIYENLVSLSGHLLFLAYEGGDTPCGECGTCIDRAKAFAENGVEDPWNGGKG